MSEQPANVSEGTVTDMAQLESNQPVGESTVVEPETQVGESSESPAESNGEPTGEGLFDGMTPEQLYESKKSLQSEYTKNIETTKALEGQLAQYGGWEQIQQWLTFMNTDEGMQKYIQNRQQEHVFGQATGRDNRGTASGRGYSKGIDTEGT